MSQDNSIPDEWYWITAPENVQIRKDSKAEEIATYGTNNPYLNYGTTKLRQLTMSRAMLEGFSNAKEVEGNIQNLEACMRMVIDEGSGFTAPYCWHVFAGSKSYGTYIIKSVSISEKMRDMSGKATRAFVDVSLQEVSPYQVTSGTDITSTAIVGDVNEKYASQLADANAGTGTGSQVASQDTAVAQANAANSETNATPGSAAELPQDLVQPVDPRSDIQSESFVETSDRYAPTDADRRAAGQPASVLDVFYPE